MPTVRHLLLSLLVRNGANLSSNGRGFSGMNTGNPCVFLFFFFSSPLAYSFHLTSLERVSAAMQ